MSEAATSTDVAGREPDAPAHWPHHTLLGAFTFVWGANFVLAEIALAELTPIAFSVARFAVAAAVLALVFGRRARHRDTDAGSRFDRRDLPRLALAAALGAALGPWLGIEGLDHTHAGRASLFVAISPAVSALIGLPMRTERLDRIALAGLATTVAGALLLAAEGLTAAKPMWLGDALLFGGILATVGEFHVLRPLVRRYGPNRIVVRRTLIGAALYAALASPWLDEQPWTQLSPMVWLAILGGGAIGVGMGQWAKTRALDVLGPTRVVVYGNLVPVATIVLALLFLGNVPRTGEIIAGALIVTGTLVLQTRRG